MGNRVKLKSLHTGVESDHYKEVSFQIYNRDEKTTLDQELILSCGPNTTEWKARIKLENFPDGLSLNEAALKMGEWLTRLGNAIYYGEDMYKMAEDIISESE